MKKLLTITLLFISATVFSQRLPAPSGTLTTMTTAQWNFRASDSTYYMYNGSTYLWAYMLTKKQGDALYQPKGVIPSLNSLSTGFGLSGSSYNGSLARTWLVDTTTITSKSFLSAYTYTKAQSDTRFVSLTGSYSNPSWITDLAYSKITGAPTSFPTPNSLSTGYGLSGSSFDGSVARTFTADTSSVTGLVSKSRLATNLSGYVPTTRTIAGFSLSSNVTLASLSAGNGINLTSYNGSTARTVSVDTTVVGSKSWSNSRFEVLGSAPTLSFAPIGSSPNANGASYSGGVITLQPANSSFGGLITSGNQSMYGIKNLVRNGASFWQFENTTLPSATIRSAVGMIGSPEQVNSFNMDYTTTGLHRFYDSSYNAVWHALSPTGEFVQIARDTTASGDVWHATGRRYLRANDFSTGRMSINTNDSIPFGDGMFYINRTANRPSISGGGSVDGLAQDSLWLDGGRLTSTNAPIFLNKNNTGMVYAPWMTLRSNSTGITMRATLVGGGGYHNWLNSAGTERGLFGYTTSLSSTFDIINKENGLLNIGTNNATVLSMNGTASTFTGSVTAPTFIGALTGNASTATALQTARTIGGVSFNGTANITVASATGGFTNSGGSLISQRNGEALVLQATTVGGGAYIQSKTSVGGSRWYLGNGASSSSVVTLMNEENDDLRLGANGVIGLTINNGIATTTTQSPGDNSTKLATTAYVDAATSVSNYVAVSGTSATATAGKVYGTLNGSMTTITLPASPVAGNTIIVNGVGAGRFRVQHGNASDTIKGVGGFTTVSGTTRGIETSDQYGTVSLRYHGSNIWTITSSQGVLSTY